MAALAFLNGDIWGKNGTIHKINGVNKFLVQATLGGLLTWPLGIARVPASSWARAS